MSYHVFILPSVYLCVSPLTADCTSLEAFKSMVRALVMRRTQAWGYELVIGFIFERLLLNDYRCCRHLYFFIFYKIWEALYFDTSCFTRIPNLNLLLYVLVLCSMSQRLNFALVVLTDWFYLLIICLFICVVFQINSEDQ